MYGNGVSMDLLLKEKILEWDYITWWKALEFWETSGIHCDKNTKVLDIGARGGGISLYWALKGGMVHCTDLDESFIKEATQLHHEFQVGDNIVYECLDAVEMQREAEYDIICFKSVLGGIGYNNNYEKQKIAISNMYKALKPGGHLIFVENLVGTGLHTFCRKSLKSYAVTLRN